MANAVVGRVLLIPKGDYASGTTYNMLDLVRYNNKSWVCKQTCTGQSPAENAYWQLMASDGAEGGYCYIRYSANSDGTGFVSAPTASTIYIGFYTGDSETAPTDKTAYTWSKFMGVDGEDGEDGASINLAGEWYVGTEYVNNGSRIDIVSKSGNSYGCLQSHIASNTNQPPNSSYWQLLAQKGADGQGSGDMLKITYDTDNDGIVDMAEGLNGLTASIEELNYMDGATGNVQEQLDDKLETETDPTVPSWAKQSEKPSYTASEVGAATEEHTHDVSDIAGSGIAHNSIYRGNYLGISVTTDQYAAISAGTFDDLFIGDYWTIGGVNYRIAAFDYYWNCGNTPLTAHHAVIVPDTCLYNTNMNDTDTTTGGYVGSQMYTTNLEQAKTTIKAAFSSHVVNHRVFLVNAVANGYSSAGAWFDSEVNLMNEQMVYGSGIFSPVSTGSAVPVNYRVEKNQLPLFAMNPAMLIAQESYWLRDVITASNFALFASTGLAYHVRAAASAGVRPAFCIS